MRVIVDDVAHEIGATQESPSIGIVDFSRRTTDDFGVTTVVPRGFARRMSVRLAIPSDDIDAVQQLLAGLRASTARWEADDRFEWLNFDGFYKEFQIDVAIPPLSFCTLTVEGLAQTEVVADAGEDPATLGSESTLKLLVPMIVDDETLTSSSVAEDDHDEWSAELSYPQGWRVIKAATHRVYESAAAGNIGHDPEDATGHWFEVGPTNRWAMFDQALGTATSGTGSITVTVDAADAQGVALLDVVGTSVQVQAAGYDETQAVGDGAVTFLDLPDVTGAVVVTITGTGTVSVGTLLIGSIHALGVTEAAPNAGITDFSRKEVDDFGEPSIVERAWAKRMSTRALIRTDAIDIVANRIAAVRARPVLWIGAAEFDTLTIYGFFKDFSIEVGQAVSTLSLSVEGLSKAAPPPPYVPPRYPDGTPIEDLRPAAPGATPGVPDGWIVGGTLNPEDGTVEGGLPAEEVLADAEAVQLETLIANARAAVDRIRDQTLLLGSDGADVRTRFQRAMDADMALAVLITAVTARLNGTSVSIEQIFEAFTDGVAGYARFVLRGIADDGSGQPAIVGIEGVADTAGSSFLRFMADVIQFIDPGTGLPMLEFDTGLGKLKTTKIVVDEVETKAIKTPMLDDGAVQRSAFGVLGSDILLSDGLGGSMTQVIFDIAVTKADSSSVLEVMAFLEAHSTDDLQFKTWLRLHVGGISSGVEVTRTCEVNLIFDNASSAAKMPITPFAHFTGIPAGGHVLRVTVQNQEAGQGLTIKQGSAVKVVELRQGSL